MGSFYTNVTLRTTNRDKVIETLREADREAYVSKPQKGGIVVYDNETEDQDIEVLRELADSLSTALRCPALAVLIHDDDVLVYTLHESGKVVDEYNSSPGFFDESSGSEEPEGGDAARLCQAFGVSDGVADVESILRRSRAGGGDTGFVFETERHEELVKALGLPIVAIGTGFNYIEQGELPEGTLDDFVRVD
jgi:hypothetical protein